MKEYDIAVIGAGKTGRGFIGRMLQEYGHPFVMIDKKETLVADIKNAGSFKVNFFGEAREPMIIKDFIIEHIESPNVDELLSKVKVIFVSVGGNNLETVGVWLSKVLSKRLKESNEECSFILCENADKPSEKLKEALLSQLSSDNKAKAENLFGFSEGVVFCTTINSRENPLGIFSENYPSYQCDGKPLKKNLPKIVFLKPIDGFENFLKRKLYTYNCASAVISYLGWVKGYDVYSDAANDEEILKILDKTYISVGEALCKEYGYEEEDQKEFAALSLRKFRDRTIIDSISRNGREPHRKLTPKERIIGPIQLIQKYGGDISTLLLTAASALLYEDPDDSEWSKQKRELGVRGILERICQLEPESTIAKGILEYYMKLQEKNVRLLELM